MTLLVLVVVYGLIQWGVDYHRLQQDQWFVVWSRWIRGLGLGSPELVVTLLAGVPAIALLVLLALLVKISGWLLLIVAVPVLLYSLGRHQISVWVADYVAAYRGGDNVLAAEIATTMGVSVDDEDQWAQLHRKVLRQAAYLGFERMFAVIFWFVLLGPVGAFLYRVLCLSRDDAANNEDVRLSAARGVWLLEWPAVRLLGLSFALTGNFVGCFQHCKAQLSEVRTTSAEVLEFFVHGALNVNGEGVIAEDINEQEVEALMPLLSRTMILWLCVVALITIAG